MLNLYWIKIALRELTTSQNTVDHVYRAFLFFFKDCKNAKQNNVISSVQIKISWNNHREIYIFLSNVHISGNIVQLCMEKLVYSTV